MAPQERPPARCVTNLLTNTLWVWLSNCHRSYLWLWNDNTLSCCIQPPSSLVFSTFSHIVLKVFKGFTKLQREAISFICQSGHPIIKENEMTLACLNLWGGRMMQGSCFQTCIRITWRVTAGLCPKSFRFWMLTFILICLIMNVCWLLF